MRTHLKRLGTGALFLCQRTTLSSAFFVARAEMGHSFRQQERSFACKSVNEDSSYDSKTIRVLALHGSEGNAEEFPIRLQSLKTALADAEMKLEITSVQAPFPKGNGFAWWKMPPGVRSYTASDYEGFEDSAHKVLAAMNAQTFDLVLGHSQGAILTSALLTLERIPYHPRRGYVLNGVAFPNPFKSQLESLEIEDAPRVLFIMGLKDRINPNSTGEKLCVGLRTSGFRTSTIKHPGGHGFPGNFEKTINDIVGWILHHD